MPDSPSKFLIEMSNASSIANSKEYYSKESVQWEIIAGNRMDRIVPDYIVGFVYGALVESFSCEQNARMMAMEAASKSAKDMLHDLDIQYNRARQAAITQEITEVIAGAKSQKKKRKK